MVSAKERPVDLLANMNHRHHLHRLSQLSYSVPKHQGPRSTVQARIRYKGARTRPVRWPCTFVRFLTNLEIAAFSSRLLRLFLQRFAALSINDFIRCRKRTFWLLISSCQLLHNSPVFVECNKAMNRSFSGHAHRNLHIGFIGR